MRYVLQVPAGLARRTQAALSFDEFQRDRLEFFRHCAETGDVVSCRLGPDTVLVLSSPELVGQVLVERWGDFSKAYLTSIMHPLLAGSLLLADSDSWLRQRRLVLPAFHREHLETYAAVMAEEADRACSDWTPGERRDLHSDMMRMTLQVVTRTMFGIDLADGVRVAERLIAMVMDEFNARIASPVRFSFPLPTLRTVRLARTMRELDRIAYQGIHRRRREPATDLMSMLIAARDENGVPMTDREVRDACIAVFFAGHETTACLLSWTWYVLAQRADVERKVLAELGDSDLQRDPASLERRLPYVQQVVNEVLRLYPPAYAFGRRAVRDTVLGGRPVPAGTTVLMSPWAMHRNPRFFDEPDEFRPERWADGLASRLPRFAFFPFSSGPRRCVGSSFATMEATIAIATILPRFKLASPVEVAPSPSITLRPAGGMPLHISRRRAA